MSEYTPVRANRASRTIMTLIDAQWGLFMPAGFISESVPLVSETGAAHAAIGRS